MAARLCRRCICSQAKRRYTPRASDTFDRIIRVDHAGELGANRIYEGQMAVLGKTSVGPTIQHMWDQEKAHLEKFEQLIVSRRVRPTVLVPFWNVAGYVLGAGTALLGKEAAMACTVAVEESISEHYDNQLRDLLQDGVTEENKELLEVIQKCRDDELDHLATGEEHDAQKHKTRKRRRIDPIGKMDAPSNGLLAPMFETIRTVIHAGCKTAIWLSERI